jgi:hypothetical protein
MFMPLAPTAVSSLWGGSLPKFYVFENKRDWISYTNKLNDKADFMSSKKPANRMVFR